MSIFNVTNPTANTPAPCTSYGSKYSAQHLMQPCLCTQLFIFYNFRNTLFVLRVTVDKAKLLFDFIIIILLNIYYNFAFGTNVLSFILLEIQFSSCEQRLTGSKYFLNITEIFSLTFSTTLPLEQTFNLLYIPIHTFRLASEG